MSTVDDASLLTPAEIEAVTALARQYEARRGACIEALRLVQRSHGWISDGRLREVAHLLEMSPDELDGVATFYNLIFRRPVGRHIILICDSVSCYVMGYNPMLERLKGRLRVELGETGADDRFTLLTIPCLGVCDHAPAMMIDNDLHVDLTPEKIEQILVRYL